MLFKQRLGDQPELQHFLVFERSCCPITSTARHSLAQLGTAQHSSAQLSLSRWLPGALALQLVTCCQPLSPPGLVLQFLLTVVECQTGTACFLTPCRASCHVGPELLIKSTDVRMRLCDWQQCRNFNSDSNSNSNFVFNSNSLSDCNLYCCHLNSPVAHKSILTFCQLHLGVKHRTFLSSCSHSTVAGAEMAALSVNQSLQLSNIMSVK